MILLVRHGQNEWVKKKRLAGWIPNVHLNDEGKEQAKQVAERLSHLPIKALYSSPVTRCMETARIIGRPLNLQVKELEGVGEVRYGEWEGEEIEKLSKEKAWHAVQHYPSRFRFPEGEALRHVQARAVDALEGLSARYDKNEMIVVVSHADLIKLTLAHYLGVHIDLFQRIVISPASVSALVLADNGVMRVARINDDGPLKPPPEDAPEGEKEGEKESDDTEAIQQGNSR